MFKVSDSPVNGISFSIMWLSDLTESESPLHLLPGLSTP